MIQKGGEKKQKSVTGKGNKKKAGVVILTSDKEKSYKENQAKKHET